MIQHSHFSAGNVKKTDMNDICPERDLKLNFGYQARRGKFINVLYMNEQLQLKICQNQGIV